MSNKITLLIGHQNPDTDSICSSIGYAYFKECMYGEKNFIPARCGNINPQTRFVLEKFDVHAPVYISDLYVRARDLMTKEVTTLKPDEPLQNAVEIFKDCALHLIPVSRDGTKADGLLTFSLIAKHLLHHADTSAPIPISIKALRQGIKAELMAGKETSEIKPVRFMVGGMEEDAFSSHIQKAKENSLPVVIVGNRENIQRIAIELRVYALVISGGLAMKDDILDLARKRGVYVLLSPYDTATTAYLARLTTPVERVAQVIEKFLSPDDKLWQIKDQILKTEDRGLVVLDDEKNLQGIITRTDLIKDYRKRVILLDHNERSQAIEGIEEAELIEIIDHHRLGDLQSTYPIKMINEPVGSTCTIIADFFHSHLKTLPANIAGLLLSGLLSDTMLFKSPTTTPLDKTMARWLGEMAHLDVTTFGTDLFTAGSCISTLSIEEIVRNDFKAYEGDLGKFGVGQTEVVGTSLIMNLKEDLINYLNTLIKKEGYIFSMLMISDMMEDGSYILYTGQEGLAERLGYEKIDANTFYAKGLLSRKKQLIPHLLESFSSMI